ncbi:MAG TPA: hypothetical protein GXZ30_10180 [Propionibacterium sp.]|jgi:hypothetical protein|nr:hypothetical protein [Propionibacterium sp.]
MSDKAHEYPPTLQGSPHDVVLTPFMVRVREATSGGDSTATLVFRHSRPERIAVATWEWFGLRTRAEHVISEANSMLDPNGDHITLEDEYGTGHLSFTLRWRDRSVCVAVDQDDPHTGQIVANSPDFEPSEAGDVLPDNEAFMEELAVSLIGINRPDIHVKEDEK